MLILTRRLGTSIVIKDNILITVLSVRGNQVRLGIEAPRDIPVHREEIYQRIRDEKPATTVKFNSSKSRGCGNAQFYLKVNSLK